MNRIEGSMKSHPILTRCGCARVRTKGARSIGVPGEVLAAFRPEDLLRLASAWISQVELCQYQVTLPESPSD